MLSSQGISEVMMWYSVGGCKGPCTCSRHEPTKDQQLHFAVAVLFIRHGVRALWVVLFCKMQEAKERNFDGDGPTHAE